MELYNFLQSEFTSAILVLVFQNPIISLHENSETSSG